MVEVKNKDELKGTERSVFVCNGATGHSRSGERAENDYYATAPKAGELLLEIEPQLNNIWEPSVGGGHLAEVFRKAGKLRIASDLVDRGYHPEGVTCKYPVDFMEFNKVWKGDIVTNPPFACVDSDTEVYTRDGWKFFKDLTLEDEIISCNIESKELEYSKIERIIDKEVNEDLYHFSNRVLDLRVTKDHRMFSVQNETGNIQRIEGDVLRAENIRKSTSAFPRSGYTFRGGEAPEYVEIPGCYVSNGQKEIWHESKKIPLKDWLEFFGLWIADGCYRDTLNSQGNHRYTISIKQHHRNIERVKEITGVLPFTVKEIVNKGRNSSNIEINSKQLWLYMSQFGKSNTKFIPRWILDLPVLYLKIFYEAYLFGDSSRLKSGALLVRTVSKQLMEDLRIIMIKLGIFPSYSEKSYTTSSGLKRTLYTLNCPKENTKCYKQVYYGEPTLEKYQGHVYCVTLKKNGFMLVKRNNKVCITGNCKGWVQHSLDCLAEGRYLALFMKIQVLEGKARRELYKENPPLRVWVSSSRIPCAKNGDEKQFEKSSAACYCWYIWQKGYKGPTELRWFN